MHPLAAGLNRKISGTIIEALLSKQGQNLYFPAGIVAQAQEAARLRPRFNATAGVAMEHNQPFLMPSLRSFINELTPDECVGYASTGGDPVLRAAWQEELLEKNPDLTGASFTLPLVTSGVSHALSLAADLFVDPGDRVFFPEPAWENYELIFAAKKLAAVAPFPFFNEEGRFNLAGLEKLLAAPAGRNKTVLILNFPHNPTGFSLSEADARALTGIIQAAAGRGRRLLVIADDAYFGLCYEPGLARQSLFARLAALHENILAVKIDGATKEDFAWGFRIGFLTLAARGLSADHHRVLEEKGLAAIRTSVSSASRLAQSLLVRVFKSESYKEEKRKAFLTLEARYQKVKAILKKESSPFLSPLPFNSGYFLCFRTRGIDALALRERLLKERGVGAIAFSRDLLRLSYASVDEELLPELFREVFAAAGELGAGAGEKRKTTDKNG